MPRFYVTATWHDWPDGGSFGTIVEAKDYDEAEHLCKLEMADVYPEPEEAYAESAEQWHIVDCYKLEDSHLGQILTRIIEIYEQPGGFTLVRPEIEKARKYLYG